MTSDFSTHLFVRLAYLETFKSSWKEKLLHSNDLLISSAELIILMSTEIWLSAVSAVTTKIHPVSEPPWGLIDSPGKMLIF